MKNTLAIIFIICLSSLAIRPLLTPGFFSVHDNAQPQRVFEMAQALHDGMFPVRWSKDMGFGYGYPLFNFYAPLAYYVGGSFMLIGFSTLLSTKVMIGLGILLSGIFMYILAKEFWGQLGGIISALLYIYAPYHAVDIYVRGDIAEMWGYACIPLAFWGFYKLASYLPEKSNIKNQIVNIQIKYKKYLWKWVAVASLGFAGIILSHNLTAMMVTPFLLVTILIYAGAGLQHAPKRFIKLNPFPLALSPLLLGLALSSFYWLPVFAEMKYTNVLSQTGGGFDFHQHFVCLNQLWTSPWGYGGSAPGCTKDGLSFMIGKVHILLTLIAVFLSFGFFKKEKQQHAIWISTGLFLLSIFFSLQISQPMWEVIHPMAFFQFPWRFLILMSFFSSFIGGSVTNYRLPIFHKNLVIRYSLFVILLLLILLSYSKFFIPQHIFPITSQQLTTKKALSWDTAIASSEYMPPGFTKPKKITDMPNSKFVFADNTGQILSQQGNVRESSAMVQIATPTILHVNTAYYPAWHAFIDGAEIPIKQTHNGMDIPVPGGEHAVVVRFLQTPIELFANVVSLAGLIILIVGIIVRSVKIRGNHI